MPVGLFVQVFAGKTKIAAEAIGVLLALSQQRQHHHVAVLESNDRSILKTQGSA